MHQCKYIYNLNFAKPSLLCFDYYSKKKNKISHMVGKLLITWKTIFYISLPDHYQCSVRTNKTFFYDKRGHDTWYIIKLEFNGEMAITMLYLFYQVFSLCVSALSGLANSSAGMSLCTCRIAWYSIINNY